MASDTGTPSSSSEAGSSSTTSTTTTTQSFPARGVHPPGTLGSLVFSSKFVDQLPADPISGAPESTTSRIVNDAAYSFVSPTPPQDSDQTAIWQKAMAEGVARDEIPTTPKSIAGWSPSAASLLGITAFTDDRIFETSVLSGSGELVQGMRPYAACYGGHQFGSWARQLGDGRAIALGEVNGWEIQLKGAGKTPYSRNGDGRAVLRSSLREFLCSEFMHFAGVPTTRAMSLVTTGTGIIRDMFYSGRPKLEPAAICSRLAPTFLRLGNFQLPSSRGDKELLKTITDFAIKNYFPDVEAGDYPAFATEVAKRNAIMVAHWMSIGFVHGVMNTDNFSILGLTIDYGPYGFLDEYDPNYTPNTTDYATLRYKYANQPWVGHWNIVQFIQALVPISTDLKLMQKAADSYNVAYEAEYERIFAQKLGLPAFNKVILDELLALLEEFRCDWNNSWRCLANVTGDSDPAAAFEEVLVPKVLSVRKTKDKLDSTNRNTANNGAGGDQAMELTPRERSLALEKAANAAKLGPEDRAKWIAWLSKYVDEIKKSGWTAAERSKVMNEVNPVYILRNYMAQVAIDKAEKGDFSEIDTLYHLLSQPYKEQKGMERYSQEPPDWAVKVGVKVNSCSS